MIGTTAGRGPAVQTCGPYGAPAWWREEWLGPEEQRLLSEVLAAHANSVVREGGMNCSAGAVVNAWAGSRDYAKAIASGLLTLGEVHGCIPAAYDILIFDLRFTIDAPELELIARGAKVPGWGNAFVKGGLDPKWERVHDLLHNEFPDIGERIHEVTCALHDAGKEVYPNPAGYTAAAAIALKMPRQVAPWLFVQGRLQQWSELILNAEREKR